MSHSSFGSSGFAHFLGTIICRAEELTRDNHTLVLTVALNFSGHDDIVNAARAIAVKVQTGSLTIDDINVSTFSNNLSMVHIDEQYRNPDLLIRTGGEQRISNFLLWQLAYSELYFSDVYWPDFDRKHLIQSIREYSNRDRRFGARF